eukprot:Nitzschia sp. Nitz4//scaffold189_size62959//18493//19779//NITZ4_006304-RA/size62959-processed-gene-0.35-mRNA-1//-1//CDS//3329539884//4057//frame0
MNEKEGSTSEKQLTFKQQTNKDRKTLKLEARARRRKFIGLAKAVDRGQFNVTYQPGGLDGLSFQAKSGLPDMSKPFVVLGIESSCDDTGAAIVRSDGVILGEALASQEKIHEEWGGVVPRLASEAHNENIDKVIELALKNANMKVSDVDAIGVTVGPGLEVCLRVGCNRARTLAMENSKPFVGIHHLEAHILMTRLDHPELDFPFLALLVSGGHCQILKCLGIGRYSVVGGTVDDSLGEAYDKTARMLNLKVGGGGGPAIEALAKEGNHLAFPFSVPLRNRQNCDFSYSGLKSNVRRAAEKLAAEQGLASTVDLPRNDRADLAASFQHIAVKHLEQRLKRAIAQVGDEMKTLAVVGGVAANMEVRSRLDLLCKKHGWEMVVPPPRLCTDQGAMSAWAAIERLRLRSSDDPTDQEVYARFPFASNETQT